ncbi:MAG: peptidase M19, partial [Anaerolineae bacterium CG_4_9_14_0_8_um_filter_58_9]
AAPADVDTIADLQKLDSILASRGYSDADIGAVLGGNWLRHLRETLPS